MAQTDNTKTATNETTTPKLCRFFFNEENYNHRRKVLIVYKLDNTTQTLTYGASVYHIARTTNDSVSMDGSRMTVKPEKYNKDKHYETALKRFNEHPVVLNNYKYPEDVVVQPNVLQKLQEDKEFNYEKYQVGEKFRKFRKNVRKQLFNHGCRHYPQEAVLTNGSSAA